MLHHILPTLKYYIYVYYVVSVIIPNLKYFKKYSSLYNLSRWEWGKNRRRKIRAILGLIMKSSSNMTIFTFLLSFYIFKVVQFHSLLIVFALSRQWLIMIYTDFGNILYYVTCFQCIIVKQHWCRYIPLPRRDIFSVLEYQRLATTRTSSPEMSYYCDNLVSHLLEIDV